MFLQRSIFGGWNTKKAIHRNDQGAFLKRLSELKSNGTPLNHAIEFLLLHQRKNLTNLHEEVLQDFLNGHTLSATLEKLGFPSFVCLHIYFAERYGDVAETLLETSTLLEHRRREIKRLAKLLHYPIFLMLLFVVILIVLNLFLLPRFTALYASLGHASTGFISFVSVMFTQLPYILLFFIVITCILFVLLLLFLRSQSPHERWAFLSNVPVVGYYVKHYHSYVFSREASYLLKGGMSFQSMLQTFISQPYRKLYHDMGQFMVDELSRGQSMYQTLLQLPYITEELKRITKHGEDNGRLEDEWKFYSRYCLTSLETKTEKIFSFIQPCLFLLLGMSIVGAYLVVLLPIFQVIQSM